MDIPFLGVAKLYGPVFFLGTIVLWQLFRERSPDQKFAAQVLEQYNTLMSENRKLKDRLDHQSEQLLALKKEVMEMEVALSNLESSHQSLPLPMWIKDMSGKMIVLNDAYESMFLLPLGKTRKDYEGHSDTDVWTPETAEKFILNDASVAVHKRAWKGLETVDLPGGKTGQVWTLKWPRMVGRRVVGIAGLALPIDYFSDIVPILED